MSWITDDHLCSECGARYIVTAKRSERETPSECEECGKEGRRTFSVPTPLRVSYHDGKDRGDTYRRLKRAAHLEKAAASLHHDKRDEIKKEIKELKKL